MAKVTYTKTADDYKIAVNGNEFGTLKTATHEFVHSNDQHLTAAINALISMCDDVNHMLVVVENFVKHSVLHVEGHNA